MNLLYFPKFNFEQFRTPSPMLPTNGRAAAPQPNPNSNAQLSASPSEETSAAGNIGPQFGDKAKIYAFASGIMIVLCVITFAVAHAVLVRKDDTAVSYTAMMDSINDIDGMAMAPFRGGVGFGEHYTQDAKSITMVLPASMDTLSLDQDAITGTLTGTLTLGTQVFVLVDSTATAQILTGTDLYAPLLTDQGHGYTSYATPTGTPQHKARKRFCTTEKNTIETGPYTPFSAEPGVGENVDDVILPV